MKLSWFLNNTGLFESEGDVPLVGQTVYLHDYTAQNTTGKKKYKINRVDRSVSLFVRDINDLKLESKEPMDRYNEAIEVIERESEGGKVTGVALPLFKISRDEAQINLEPWSIEVLADNLK